MPEKEQQLQQLVVDDLPGLISYYLEVSSEKGPGVLVLNVYSDAELVEQEARFLKASQLSGFIEESGLTMLQTQFEAHDPETQMVMAVITNDQMGAFTVDAPRPESKRLPVRRRRPKVKGFGN